MLFGMNALLMVVLMAWNQIKQWDQEHWERKSCGLEAE
jgi:hypothetical protein